MRCVYYSVNFQLDESVDRFIGVIEEAADIGYNGFVITDYKFGRIKDRPENYYNNIRRTQDAADKLGIEIIPGIMSPSILMVSSTMHLIEVQQADIMICVE
ncbi:hypothetical protein GF312_07160 [Candidatus Poribacteria bacterium]|nr:hypothetical protein [Candidatus Poribacteria bacterium]